MSKELSQKRYAQGTVASRPGAPYTKQSPAPLSSSAAVPAASGAPKPGAPRISINNFSSFHARVKKLPPDANTKAAVNTKLWQFAEPVLFACAKCRRDNIQSDSVAIDSKNRIILCTPCFTRIVRPRTYKPSRVVPFPSLLSWLNYIPSKAATVSEDVMARPAEAVAPSGNRMVLPALANGDRPTSLDRLPAIGMRIVPGAGAAAGVGVAGSSSGGGRAEATHPCLRVWGVCQHGETCLFRNAPADLCLAYLMGLCKGDGGRGGRRTRTGHAAHTDHTCSLLHQHAYDLPGATDPPPEVRYVGELEGDNGGEEPEESPWERWIVRRRRSPNSAEWQLWHNGPLQPIFDAFVSARERPRRPKTMAPATKPESKPTPAPAPVTEAAPAEDVRKNEEAAEVPAPPANVKLNLSDIMSALKEIKKE